jgi:serine/threonine protein kinase
MNAGPSIKDFSILSVIGKGTYAKVLLVRHLKDNQLYALKVLKKKYILEQNQEKHIMTEKSILAAIEHPFLVKLRMSFQDEKKLYFLLEYCPGGELFSLLAAKDKLTEDQYTDIHQGPNFTARRSSSLWKPFTKIKLSTASNCSST